MDSAPRSPIYLADGLMSCTSTPSASASAFAIRGSISFEAGMVSSLLDKLMLKHIET
jgi:hypothetical protein